MRKPLSTSEADTEKDARQRAKEARNMNGRPQDKDHMIRNPVLPGFNPDPSMLRVGEDYYIATSTFEWFPGVAIYHSKDLVHWRLAARPLTRVSQLDMRGCFNSAGVWAPCLSYDKGLFYLTYTNVGYFDQTLFAYETPNFLVTAEKIDGEWSEPVPLNSSGFDPSLFHDDDGRKWLVNMVWDHRRGVNHFGGVLLQEYSTDQKRLIGPFKNIFRGTELRITEGPHLYKRNGYYYLMTAEGGTSWDHAVTTARSKSIWGPYEVDPRNPLITSAKNPNLKLQKAGHASLIETHTGEWYLAHLCGRPLSKRGRCVLGRETSIQKVHWTNEGWLRLDGGGHEPKIAVPAPNIAPHPWPKEPDRDDFDSGKLGIHFMTPRIPLGEDRVTLKERPGFLRLKGRFFLTSHCEQVTVARRQRAFKYTATTCVEYEPEFFQQMAGLTCFYDTNNFYYLHISRDDKYGKLLNIVGSKRKNRRYYLTKPVSIEGWKRVYLRVEVDHFKLQFYFSKDGKDWKKIGPLMDASVLSDEFASKFAFTGAFVGMSCQDISGRMKHADFDFFEYVEQP